MVLKLFSLRDPSMLQKIHNILIPLQTLMTPVPPPLALPSPHRKSLSCFWCLSFPCTFFTPTYIFM